MYPETQNFAFRNKLLKISNASESYILQAEEHPDESGNSKQNLSDASNTSKLCVDPKEFLMATVF